MMNNNKTIFAVFTLLAFVFSAATYASSVAVVEQRVQPADTGAGIDRELLNRDLHQVVQPQLASERKNVLVLYLVGSLASTNNALDISRFAAGLGYGVLNLQYPNRTVVGVICGGDDACYEAYRGETIFGQNTAYALGQPSYNELKNFVTRENSIVNRLLSLLDYLAHQSPTVNNPQPAYWRQFLYQDPNSPYSTANLGAVYPAWSRIVVAGHSQGGGMAPMLASNLPNADPLRRLVMFAAPNDNTGGRNGNLSASWILAPSATPLERYWGLRHADDGQGSYVQQNWANMGGVGSGGVGGTANNAEVDIGDGTGSPQGAQRLVLSADVGGVNAHLSVSDASILPTVVSAWEYLFTAGGTD